MWTFTWTSALVEILACAFCALVLLNLTMALYRYFKLADNVLPSPMGDLSSSVSLATTKKHSQYLTLNAKIKPWKILLERKWDFRENLDQQKFLAIQYDISWMYGDDNAKCFDLPLPLPTSLLPLSPLLIFFSPHSSPSSLLGRHIWECG